MVAINEIQESRPVGNKDDPYWPNGGNGLLVMV